MILEGFITEDDPRTPLKAWNLSSKNVRPSSRAKSHPIELLRRRWKRQAQWTAAASAQFNEFQEALGLVCEDIPGLEQRQPIPQAAQAIHRFAR